MPAHTLAEPSIGGSIHGTGTASTFTVYKEGGTSLQGGAYQRNLVCSPCRILVTLTEGEVRVVQDGDAYVLAPGAYDVREYTGTFSYTQRAPGRFSIQMDGTGIVREA